MLNIVANNNYNGYIRIEYEGSVHTEFEGITLTRDLLKKHILTLVTAKIVDIYIKFACFNILSICKLLGKVLPLISS